MFNRLTRKIPPLWKDEAVPGRIPLCNLKDIPEEALMSVVPVLRQGWTANECEVGIACRDDIGKESIVYLGPEGSAATRFFDGGRTLEQVAEALEAELGMTPERCISIVRETFLILAMREVYHPKNPPDPPQTLPPDGTQNA